MRTIPLFIATLLACLLFAGCDIQTARRELNGSWVTYGDMSIEFTSARFTRTMPNGEVRAGTYVTDGGFITFHRTGHSSERQPYKVSFPRLILGDRTYFHDSPRIPDDIEGVWLGFASLDSTSMWPPRTIRMSPASPQRGNPWVREGTWELLGLFKGEYTISARNLPNVGTFTRNVTHVYGGDLYAFIRYQLHVRFMYLFDWENLGFPYDPNYWWVSLDEVRNLFLDAAQRAGDDLAAESLIMLAKEVYLFGLDETTAIDYSLVEVDEVIYDLTGAEVEGSIVLTLRFPAGTILTFVRMEE